MRRAADAAGSADAAEHVRYGARTSLRGVIHGAASMADVGIPFPTSHGANRSRTWPSCTAGGERRERGAYCIEGEIAENFWHPSTAGLGAGGMDTCGSGQPSSAIAGETDETWHKPGGIGGKGGLRLACDRPKVDACGRVILRECDARNTKGEEGKTGA